MGIFPERWMGRGIPIEKLPKYYTKNGKKYNTRTKEEVLKNNKQKKGFKMNDKTIETLEEFLEKMGPDFHIRLMMLHENMLKDEYKPKDDDTILHFEFPQGEYSIRYGLLKARADQETLDLLEKNNLQIKLGPLGKGEQRITHKSVPPAPIKMVSKKNKPSNNDVN